MGIYINRKTYEYFHIASKLNKKKPLLERLFSKKLIEFLSE